MKFIYADSMDYIDPAFDFDADRSHAGRVAHRDDQYPHEFLGYAPYDGILVSRAIVGDVGMRGKYNESQVMRFRREGARAFLRYAEKRYPRSLLFGDCGAFSYRNQPEPPYGVEDTLSFYDDGGFTHGCSIDHVILDFDDGGGRKREQVSEDVRSRYDITLQLAAEFKKASRSLKGFVPLGVVQGWSTESMAAAAKKLVGMGYDYLAVGGLVPLKIDQIHRALAAVRHAVPARTRLHLLGFGKIESLDEIERHGVASFDTTSPLLRSFKDSKKNYFHRDGSGKLEYYTAIRIPQATENTKLKHKAMEGALNQEKIVALQDGALSAVRGYAKRSVGLETAVDNVMAYWRALNWEQGSSPSRLREQLARQREIYRRTLGDRPWEHCSCRVCRDGGVETVIFRSSNRNKRRGIHNLHVFYDHLQAHRSAAA